MTPHIKQLFLNGLLILSSILLTTSDTSSQPAPDTRKDWYEVQHLPGYARYANSVLHHTGSGLLTPVIGGYDFKVKTWRNANNNVSDSLCPSTRFYGQLVPRPMTGSTAILVGQDVILIPKHTWNGSSLDTTPELVCQSGLRVFLSDFRQTSPTNPPIGADSILTLSFKSDNVYFCDSVLGYGKPGDWVVVKLDRPMPMRRIPLKVRRYGDPYIGDSTIMMGHHNRMSLKIEDSEVLRTGGSIRTSGLVRAGNSGSPIINKRTGKMESMVTSGGVLVFTPVDNNGDTCYTDDFDDDALWATSINARLFANLIPPIGIQWADNVLEIDHYGPPGGPFTNDQLFNHTFYVPKKELRYIPLTSIQADPERGLIAFPPYFVFPDTMFPGDDFTISDLYITPNADSLDFGIYDAPLQVGDGAYHTLEELIHRFHVGVGGYELICPGERKNCSISLSANPADTFKLVNLYDVAQHIEVRKSEKWVTVNGHNLNDTLVVPPHDTLQFIVAYDTTNLIPGATYENGIVELQAIYGNQYSPEINLITLRGFTLAPDLVPTNLYNHPIRAAYGNYLVSTDIVNRGVRPAGPSTLRISRQDIFDGFPPNPPVTIIDTVIPGLLPNDTFHIEQHFNHINGLAITLYVIFEADVFDVVSESQEGNNVQILDVNKSGDYPQPVKLKTVAEADPSSPVKKASMICYPNPVNQQLILEGITGELGHATIRISDLSGRHILTTDWNAWPRQKSLDVSRLGNGIYLLYLLDGNEVVDVKRIVKNDER